MKEKTLVVMAAGMGSRFGGMKQIEPVGPNGEFIIDYSIYSAIRYGFNKVVFVIKEENYEIFKETIGSRIEDKVKVEYAFQKLDDIPQGFDVPAGRAKPWGTAHAIYCAREYINGNFGVIAADDFYGDNAFEVLSQALDKDTYSLVGYEIGGTLSANGAVKRGVIITDGSKVSNIIESSCSLEGDKAKCVPLDSSKEEFYVEKNQLASMSLYGFTPSILVTIADQMSREFSENSENLMDYEMLLPDIMNDEIANGKTIEVYRTSSTWKGITYREDVVALKEFILKQIEDGIYPNKLWD